MSAAPVRNGQTGRRAQLMVVLLAVLCVVITGFGPRTAWAAPTPAPAPTPVPGADALPHRDGSGVSRGVLNSAATVAESDTPLPTDPVGPPTGSEVARADDLLVDRTDVDTTQGEPHSTSWSRFSSDQKTVTSSGPDNVESRRPALRSPYASRAARPLSPAQDRTLDLSLLAAGDNRSLLTLASSDDRTNPEWHDKDTDAVIPTAGNTYAISSRWLLNPTTGRALTGAVGGELGGQTSIDPDTERGAVQQWSFVDAGADDGYLRIINHGDGLCLTNLDASPAEGAGVGTYPCQGDTTEDDANLWKLVTPPHSSHNLFYLQNKSSGQMLHLTADGTHVEQAHLPTIDSPFPGFTWSFAEVYQPGGVVPTWSAADSGSVGFPAAMATGDLDRQVGDDQQYHDEAVVAYASDTAAKHQLQVRVIDYNANTSHLLQTSWSPSDVSLGDDAGQYLGSVGVAVGDFDGDDLNEIAVTWQRPDNGQFNVQLLRYAADGSKRTLVADGSYQNPIKLSALGKPLPIGRGSGTSSTTATDVDGDSRADLVISFVTPSDSRKHAYINVNSFTNTGRVAKTNVHQLPQITATPDQEVIDTTWTTRGIQVVPALLRYDPLKGYLLHRRQLAVTYSLLDRTRHTMATALVGVDVDVSSKDGSYSFADLAPSFPFVDVAVNVTEETATHSLPMSITAGGLGGPRSAGADTAEWGIVLGYPRPLVNDSVTQTWRLADSNDQLTLAYQHSTPGAQPVTVTAYDRTGRSMLLGAPIIISIDKVTKPDVIGAQPPTHGDWVDGEFVNLTRTGDLTVELGQGSDTDLKGTHTAKAATTIGVSETLNLEASVELGFKDIVEAGGSEELTQKFSYDWDTESSDYNSHQVTQSWSNTSKTTDDDILDVYVTTYLVYRYPIIGAAPLPGDSSLGCAEKCYPFYEVTLPATSALVQGAGRDFSFYQPPWQNGNALSYPVLDSNQVPISDLGSYTYQDKNNDTQTVQKALYTGTHDVSGNESTATMDFSSSQGSGKDRTSGGGMSNGLDSKTTVSGSVTIGVGKVETKDSVTIGFDKKDTWSTTNTSESTVTAKTGFKLEVPQTDATRGYRVGTAYYTSSAGAQKVVHGVNLTGVRTGADWWKRTYGQSSDLALNLPDAISPTFNERTRKFDDLKWSQAPTRQLIRGFQVVHPDDDRDPSAGDPYTIDGISAVPTGDPVQFTVQVHNYSLKQSDKAPARFFAVPVTADNLNLTGGARIDLGTADVPPLAPQGMTTITSPTWDAQGPDSAGVQNWRIFVQLNPDNVEEIHPLTGQETCPLDSINTTSDQLLIDPATGTEETLSCGQNNQGFGELSVINTGLAGASGRPEVKLDGARLANGGLQGGSGTPRVEVGQNVTGLVQIASTTTGSSSARVMVYDGPRSKNDLVGYTGVGAVDAQDGGYARYSWQPRTAGRHVLHQILVDADGTTSSQTQTVDVVARPGAVAKLVVSPKNKTVVPGTQQTYRVTAYDANHTVIGDVTSDTTLSIAGGTCEGNICSATSRGLHLVTARRAGLSAKAYLFIRRPARIQISPKQATAKTGEAVTYRATAYDKAGARIGDITPSATFTLDNGTCVQSRCSTHKAGRHRVVAHYAELTSRAVLRIR